MTKHVHTWKHRTMPREAVPWGPAQQMAWALTSDAFKFGALICSDCGAICVPSRELAPDEIKQIEEHGIPKGRFR